MQREHLLFSYLSVLFCLLLSPSFILCKSNKPYDGREVKSCVDCYSNETCKTCGDGAYSCFPSHIDLTCCGCLESNSSCYGCRHGSFCTSNNFRYSCHSEDSVNLHFLWILFLPTIIIIVIIIYFIRKARKNDKLSSYTYSPPPTYNTTSYSQTNPYHTSSNPSAPIYQGGYTNNPPQYGSNVMNYQQPPPYGSNTNTRTQ